MSQTLAWTIPNETLFACGIVTGAGVFVWLELKLELELELGLASGTEGWVAERNPPCAHPNSRQAIPKMRNILIVCIPGECATSRPAQAPIASLQPSIIWAVVGVANALKWVFSIWFRVDFELYGRNHLSSV